MEIEVKKSTLSGSIFPSPSKSQSLRALIFALLANGKSIIKNYLKSPDTYDMIKAIKALGAKIDIEEDKLIIKGTNLNMPPCSKTIDAGNSGIILRFIGAIAALNSSFTIITGDNSIQKNRIVAPLLDGLTQLNVYAKSIKGNDLAPIVIKGPIKPKKIIVDGKDSQPISALIIASAFSSGDVEIIVKNPGELPWIELTLSWLDFFNIKYINKNFSYFKIFGNNSIEGFEKVIEPDFSSLAFPLVASIITNSKIKIKNIDLSQNGGDKKLIDALKTFGANIQIDKNKKEITTIESEKITGKEIDINNFIDALPILSVLGCYAEGQTILKNAKIARFKESDRLKTITKELKKLGADIKEYEDKLIINKSKLIGATVNSNKDHRIAMSLAITGLIAEGNTTIQDCKCIEKSYPNFIADMKKLNANINII